ncbi:MAG: helix-turn-helix transcriptional regulator [Clostridia bacterium]|nr:helix-turn-helix transcriptional regulator [Clostridia bacterium]
MKSLARDGQKDQELLDGAADLLASAGTALLEARKRNGLTQKALSEKTGIAQADISRLENGCSNPSLRTLQRLAAGIGLRVQLSLVPAAEDSEE